MPLRPAIEFRAVNRKVQMETFRLEPLPGEVEWDLGCAGVGDAFIDYRYTSRPETVQAWLAAPRPQRQIMAAYYADEEPAIYESSLPLLDWDGLVYILQTTPSRAL